ncbi:MAG: TIGR03009 domain-containing protein [Planctomycetota bacterium]|nr:TIGR03009 domain-containing protein [Planctomycetota bacterium]
MPCHPQPATRRLPRLLLLLAAAALARPVPAQQAALPQAPPAQGAAQPPQAQPPHLTAEQQVALDQLLAAWETRNSAVRTWSCTFHKWEYNAWSPSDAGGERLAFAESSGELKYAAPDKGLFRVKETKQWSPEARRYEVRGGDAGEHWVCNGESIYEFRHAERQLRETKLPADMRGTAISEGPLPFVFGSKATALKKRYWMRIITPPDVRDQIWLEALPKEQRDAANFSKVELILQRDLMPFAIQIYKPGGQDRDVYQFDPRTNLIDKGLDLIRDFAKPMTPFGYKYVLEDLQAAAAAPPGSSVR